jgi:uncharacterized protein with PQ loop repeat
MIQSIINFVLEIFSSILFMNLRDHHEIPFALPLVAFSVTGFLIGFIILRFIGNEDKEMQQHEQNAQKYKE